MGKNLKYNLGREYCNSLHIPINDYNILGYFQLSDFNKDSISVGDVLYSEDIKDDDGLGNVPKPVPGRDSGEESLVSPKGRDHLLPDPGNPDPGNPNSGNVDVVSLEKLSQSIIDILTYITDSDDIADNRIIVEGVGIISISKKRNYITNKMDYVVTDIIPIGNNNMFYNSKLEVYYKIENQTVKVMFYNDYTRQDNVSVTTLNPLGENSRKTINLVPQYNDLGSTYNDYLIFADPTNALEYSLINQIPVKGRFQATKDDVTIVISKNANFASNNPEIVNGKIYEYNYYNRIFNLMEVKDSV